MIPGPVSLEEYERTHYAPAQDDEVLYATSCHIILQGSEVVPCTCKRCLPLIKPILFF